MQVWEGAVQASKDKGIHAGAVAAAAMFVLVVTRTNDEWASWSEHDNMFVRYVCINNSRRSLLCSATAEPCAPSLACQVQDLHEPTSQVVKS